MSPGKTPWIDPPAKDLWAPIDGRYWCPDPNCVKAFPQKVFKGYKTFKLVRRHVHDRVRAGLGHWGLDRNFPTRREKSSTQVVPAPSTAAVSSVTEPEPKSCMAAIESSLVPLAETASKAGAAGTASSAAKAGTASQAAALTAKKRQRGPSGHCLRGFNGKVPTLPVLTEAPSKRKKTASRASQPEPSSASQQEEHSTAGLPHTAPQASTACTACTAGTADALQDSDQLTVADCSFLQT